MALVGVIGSRGPIVGSNVSRHGAMVGVTNGVANALGRAMRHAVVSWSGSRRLFTTKARSTFVT